MEIRRMSAIAAISIAVAGVGLGTIVPAAAAGTPTVTANPNANLTNGQTVTATVTNFEASTQIYLVQCTKTVETSKSSADCDTGTLQTPTTDASGSATASFTVASGSSYTDGDGGKCDSSDPCDIVAVDNPFAPTDEAFAGITFAAVTAPVTTTTKVTAPKSGKVGKKVSVTATTAPTSGGSAAFGGTVTFTDNKKAVGTVQETSTGVVKESVKLAKGKNTIVATYSGNSAYAKSSGSATVTAKKK